MDHGPVLEVVSNIVFHFTGSHVHSPDDVEVESTLAQLGVTGDKLPELRAQLADEYECDLPANLVTLNATVKAIMLGLIPLVRSRQELPVRP
jgi:hypothetical protein